MIYRRMPTTRNIAVRAWLEALADATLAFELRTLKAATKRASSGSPREFIAVLLPRGSRKETRLLVETRSRLTPREALLVSAELIKRAKGVSGAMIACPYISPRVAEICRECGLSYLDQAGNCDIRADGLAVHIQGRPNAAPDTRPLLDPFAAKSSRIARVLLAHPERSWHVKALAAAAQVSIGLASKAKNALIEQGYAQEREGQVELRDAHAMLEAWRAAYKAPVQRHSLFVLNEIDRAELAVAEWCQAHRIQYGLAEFSGAWRLAPMVRYKQASVCVRASATDDLLPRLLKSVEAKPVESGSNLAILVTSDDALFYDAREAGGIRVLSPIQLYLDLHSNPGRGREAADELMRVAIRPGLKEVSKTLKQG